MNLKLRLSMVAEVEG